MKHSSPLGVSWRPFHQERVFNAVNNLVNAGPLRALGLTSWESLEDISDAIKSSAPPVKVYIISAFPYLLDSFSLNWLKYDQINQYGPMLDYVCIVSAAAISAEFNRLLSRHNFSFLVSSRLLDWFWPISTFILFLTSPLTYRMMLAPWHEVPWLAFTMLFYMCTIKSRPQLGLVFLALAGFFHWYWSFMMALFYFISLILPEPSSSAGNAKSLFPPNLRGAQNIKSLFVVLLLPSLIHQLSLFIASRYYLISSSGSSPLYRIGIDSPANIHHGGILAAWQFLGGNRFSVCLDTTLVDSRININIFRFNCASAIAGCALVSVIALISYLVASQRENTLRWVLVPMCWSYLVFLLIFQQTNAAHLQGHSFIFVEIYAFGIVYLLALLSSVLRFSHRATIMVSSPVIFAIAINSIRVNYLTGING